MLMCLLLLLFFEVIDIGNRKFPRYEVFFWQFLTVCS